LDIVIRFRKSDRHWVRVDRDNDKVLDGGDGDIGGGFRLGNGKKTYGIGGGLNRLGVNPIDF
jgi:hypothetical protein